MRGCFAAATLAACFLLHPAPARADISDFIGKPVGAVTVMSSGRPTNDPRLIELVETATGQPLRVADVRESVAHLFSLGQYEDVRVHAAAAGPSVALTYELVPLRVIQDISFTGDHAPGIDAGRMRRLIAQRFGTSPAPGRAPDIEVLVLNDLREAGYLRPRITSQIEPASDDARSVLAVTIVPGDRTRIGAIDVDGDPGMSVPQFLDALHLSRGAPFEREALNARIDRFLDQRRSRGFFAARVSYSPQFADDDRIANLAVTIVPGPHVSLVFAGDPLPNDRRDDLVPIAREGSADEDVLEDATNRIEEQLRAQGYRDAAAPHAREERDGELIVTFTVHRGPQYRVGRVDVSGNTSISLTDLQQHLLIRPGQPFSDSALESEHTLIEDLYHREGFASAQVAITSDSEPPVAGAVDVPVAIRIAITENVRTTVERVRFEGNTVSESVLREGLTLQNGRPFSASALAADRDTIQLRLANLGFQAATVTANPGFSADNQRANVVLTVREGQRIAVDHVLIVGNVRTRTATIERELQFKAGEPLGLEQINESQRRLAALGLFRRVRITELAHGDESKRDVLVSLEEAPVTTLGYGAGIEAGQLLLTDKETEVASQQLEVAPRAFFEIGRRNLLGKNRSVNLFTRVSLGNLQSQTTSRGFGEYRVIGTYREPRALGSPVDAFLTGTLEQQHRSSFNFARRSFSAEAGRRVSRTVSVSGTYQIQRTELFDEQIEPADRVPIDRLFPQIRISSFASSVVRDTRDDLADPSDGRFFSANGQIAGRRIGSEVGFVKSYLVGQMFRTIPHARRSVFAGSARFGLAAGFPRLAVDRDAGGNVLLGSDGQPQLVTVHDVPASERFFAGGDTTVRGFALDQLGSSATIDKDGFPQGGEGLVIFNAEVRVPVARGLGIVGFVDSGNVFAHVRDISLPDLRGSVGFGVRYRSPIGPIRVDLGFKLHRQVNALDLREPLTALHITLGQAF